MAVYVAVRIPSSPLSPSTCGTLVGHSRLVIIEPLVRGYSHTRNDTYEHSPTRHGRGGWSLTGRIPEDVKFAIWESSNKIIETRSVTAREATPVNVNVVRPSDSDDGNSNFLT